MTVNASNADQKVQLDISGENTIPVNNIIEDLPEMETFEVELIKDQQGLGITIAGYVCEKGTSLSLPSLPFQSV